MVLLTLLTERPHYRGAGGIGSQWVYCAGDAATSRPRTMSQPLMSGFQARTRMVGSGVRSLDLVAAGQLGAAPGVVGIVGGIHVARCGNFSGEA